MTTSTFYRHLQLARLLSSSSQIFAEHWFKYSAVRGTKLTDSRGNDVMLREGSLFSVTEMTRKADRIAVSGYPKLKFNLPIATSELLMKKAKPYKGKPPTTVNKVVVEIPKVEHLAKSLKVLPHLVKPKARVTKTVHPSSDQPRPVTANPHGRLPLMPILDDVSSFQELDELGIDFGGNSFSGEIIPGGVYSSVCPDKTTHAHLNKLVRLVDFIEPDTSKFHCTVLYSRNDRKASERPDLSEEQVYKARIQEFLIWPGHDGKKYLVGLLECEDLHRANTDWLDLGYTSDFPKFRPHITVKTGIDSPREEEAVEILNRYLDTNPDLVLNFGSQVVEALVD